MRLIVKREELTESRKWLGSALAAIQRERALVSIYCRVGCLTVTPPGCQYQAYKQYFAIPTPTSGRTGGGLECAARVLGGEEVRHLFWPPMAIYGSCFQIYQVIASKKTC